MAVDSTFLSPQTHQLVLSYSCLIKRHIYGSTLSLELVGDENLINNAEDIATRKNFLLLNLRVEQIFDETYSFR